MKLWEKKHLSVVLNIPRAIIYPQWAFMVSGDVCDIISDSLNKLELKPFTRKLKNKLKSKQYIQFTIAAIGYLIGGKKISASEPDFKWRDDAVEITLFLPFIEYNEKNYMGIFLNNLKIGIKEGLQELDISTVYIDSVFKNI